MTILVTGSMGHVGFEVVRQAVARDHQVVAIYRGTFRARDARRRSAATSPGCAPIWPMRRRFAAIADTHAIKGVHPYRGRAQRQRRTARSARRRQIERGQRGQPARAGTAKRGWRRFVNVSTGSVFQNATDPVTPILEEPDAVRHQHLQHHEVLRRAADHHVSLAVRRVGGDGAHLVGVRAAAGAAHPRQSARADPLVPQVRAHRRAGRGAGRQRLRGELHACLRRRRRPAGGLRGRRRCAIRSITWARAGTSRPPRSCARCAPLCRRR